MEKNVGSSERTKRRRRKEYEEHLAVMAATGVDICSCERCESAKAEALDISHSSTESFTSSDSDDEHKVILVI